MLLEAAAGGNGFGGNVANATATAKEQRKTIAEFIPITYSLPSDYGLFVEEYKKSHPAKPTTVEQVADHIDHVVKIAGVKHVGLGSDFDGVSDLPVGLGDVSQYPNLVRVMLQRGYSEADIEAILGGNLLRVWQDIEDHAKRNPGGG